MQTVNLPRVAIVCDMLEEDWPSMNLVAEMLFQSLERNHSNEFTSSCVRPMMKRRFSRARENGNAVHSNGRRVVAWRTRSFNADRFINRMWDYPRWLSKKCVDYDLFHLVDHSYAQLVHSLPPERTIVTCHDVDTFECLLNPAEERRSPLFKRMTMRTLSGFRRAAHVTCDSRATRDELMRHQLVHADKITVIPNGVDSRCSPTPDIASDSHVETLIGPAGKYTDLLHVGSTIRRKRIDQLLRIFASLKESFPHARLLRVGGNLAADQQLLAEKLKLSGSIISLRHLDRKILAAVYRRAALVMLPSEREGFGLPVVEAMACGTPVVATDLPVLREVGGDAASYCQLSDVEQWANTIASLLTERQQDAEGWVRRREAGIAQAAKFTWAEYAGRMVQVYQSVLGTTAARKS